MDKKIILFISGTRKGIGKELVKYYVQNNNNIVIGCSRGDSDLDYPNYFHHKVNVTDENNVKKMFIWIRKNFKSLHVIINNAGIASMNHTLLTPIKKAQEIINTNFIGTFLLSREAAKIMKYQSYGRIINVTSVGTQMKLEGEAMYTSSKSAVENLTVVMSRELADFGTTVNAVGLTPVMTDLIKFVPKEKINNILNNLAFNRLTEIDDVINVLDFFKSNKSNYITGQIIHLGGG